MTAICTSMSSKISLTSALAPISLCAEHQLRLVSSDHGTEGNGGHFDLRNFRNLMENLLGLAKLILILSQLRPADK